MNVSSATHPHRWEDLGVFPAHRRHVLDLDDFSSEEIHLVLSTARVMKQVLERKIKKVPTLKGKAVITLFYEPSTRTRVSFELAGKFLNADVINLTADFSSTTKGESLLNTALTLQAAQADIIVLRHPHSGAPYMMARHLNTSVVNAGDGMHAHPTQALLDLYTIQEKLGGIDGLRVGILGDILHSRVARSNIWGLTTLGARVVLCAPPTLLPLDLLPGRGSNVYPGSVQVVDRVEEAIEGLDAVMVLRLQQERQEDGLLPSLREYAVRYQLNEERLKLCKPGALVLHPGPMNEGVEISASVAHGAQSFISQQVTNGVAVRMALLYLLTRGELLV